MKKPELVVPAGNLEKLKIAIMYGADAVYMGGESFNLRKHAPNFSLFQIGEAVDYVKKNKKKIYFTLNSFLYENDLSALKKYLDGLKDFQFDGIIVSDPGMFDLVGKNWPNTRIHLSTQANTMNRNAVGFWAGNGISRVVLARELTLSEINSIVKNSSCETEVFIHGAVCLSYSGRCYLSKYMTDRDANQGDCSHSCRWQYALVEEKRPGEYFPVFEDGGSSFILNSQDICGIKAIPDIISAGVDALKIEGRMKSLYYLSVVTMVYRKAIDAFFTDEEYKVKDDWINELEMVSHRPYNYRPFAESREDLSQDLERCRPSGIFLALVERELANGYVSVSVRNSLRTGEFVDIISPRKIYGAEITEMRDKDNNLISITHPNQEVKIKLSQEAGYGCLLRRKLTEKVKESNYV